VFRIHRTPRVQKLRQGQFQSPFRGDRTRTRPPWDALKKTNHRGTEDTEGETRRQNYFKDVTRGYDGGTRSGYRSRDRRGNRGASAARAGIARIRVRIVPLSRTDAARLIL